MIITNSACKLIYRCVLTVVTWIFSTLIQAAEPDPLFNSQELLNISLTGPFRTINRERDKETEYEGGSLAYTDSTGEIVTLDAKFKVRGNFRLRDDICDYAQLWVDLDKDDVAGTLFENQNRIKLVVQCDDSSKFERYVIKEHQAYQLFNAITDTSFRSRLARVTYKDTERDSERTHYGVFIEHRNRMAERIGMETVELNRIERNTLDQVQGTLASIFMFMAGNTDFSFITAPEDECCHNAKLFQPPGQAIYFPAPYDFDSSGYVDADYAEPNAALRLRSNRQRLYRGFCVPEMVLNEALELFRNKESELMAIASDSSYMDERYARGSAKYIQDFLDIINDPDEVEDEIIDDCR